MWTVLGARAPKVNLIAIPHAAARLHQTSRSCVAQHFRKARVGYADEADLLRTCHNNRFDDCLLILLVDYRRIIAMRLTAAQIGRLETLEQEKSERKGISSWIGLFCHNLCVLYGVLDGRTQPE